ncbi:MAG: hypothetical protein CK529_04755 [Rhodospirillaceae bacterium]|nr:MAG: hypothetical protein CK529_04755 [Rhodospirillaceae bacterium]
MVSRVLESEITIAFLKHWQALSPSGGIPNIAAYLDSIDLRLVPISLIFECTCRDMILRFQDTRLVERWGVDQTNQSWLAGKSAPNAAATLANMTDIVDNPCGGFGHCIYYTRQDFVTKLEVLSLPLAVNVTRPKRLVMIYNIAEPLKESDGLKAQVWCPRTIHSWRHLWLVQWAVPGAFLAL